MGKIILGTIAAAGILTVAAVAPNALKAVDLFYGKEKRKYYRDSYVKKAITKLKDRGLVEFEKRGEKSFARLTQKGERELLRYQLKGAIIKKPKKWDRKWRVVIFDIKEQRKFTRDEIRKNLTNLGFLRLQNSVWVYPYDCEEIIIMMKAYFKIGKDVLYMTVEQIENDKWLKEEFRLN